MSGHSKWANIKHRKERADAKKGKVFSQLSKEISIAAKNNSQPALEKAIAKAKAANMPKKNIHKALQNSKSADNAEQITYEVVGPFGTGFLVEIATDNKNRALPEIKQILKKHNAQLGSVSWMFNPDKTPKYPLDLKNEQINNFLEDLKAHEDVQEVYSNLK